MSTVKELADEIKLVCFCGKHFTVREGSKMERENPNSCLDAHGWIKVWLVFSHSH